MVFATQLEELAIAICDREQRCGKVDAGADYAGCLDLWKNSFAKQWAGECGNVNVACPNGIPEARFQELCVDVPRTLVPCNSLFGIIAYLEPSCGLPEICAWVPQDAGGQ